MSWRALRCALGCDKHESTAQWALLVAYADHADERGYSWPSKRSIASTCRLHHTSVARAIETLIAKKLIFRTKKRRGNTHQVNVYRMPKITYESGLKSDASKSPQSGHKASGKRRISGLICDTNLDTDNQEPISISGDGTLGVASTTGGQPNGQVSKSLVEGYQYQKQNQSARDHVKWPEFVAWCKKVDPSGTPRREGFDTWLSKQKPQWRNKVKTRMKENCYELNGKFYSEEEANRIAISDPGLSLKFRRAIRYSGGRVGVLTPPTS